MDDGSGKIYKNGVVAECTHVDPDHISFFEMQGLLKEMEINPRSIIYYKLPGKTLEDGLVLLGEGDPEILTMFEKCKEYPVIHIYIIVVEERLLHQIVSMTTMSLCLRKWRKKKARRISNWRRILLTTSQFMILKIPN